MNEKILFYQESKNVNVVRLTIAYFTLALLALTLGYGYSVLTVAIPIIYANFVLTFGYGLLLGLSIKMSVRLTHNRNCNSQMMLAIVTGIMANYFQWTAYILYIFNEGHLPFSDYLANLHWIIQPSNLFGVIKEINQVGSWGFMGIVFNGWALTIIWVLEAAIIAGIPIVLLLKTNIYPYSEALNKWYPKYTVANDFESLSLVKRFVNQLSENPIEAISTLGKGNGLRHCKLHIHFLEHEEIQYLTFENIFMEGQGKGKKVGTEMVSNFKVETAVAQELMDKYHIKRERFEVV